MGITENISPLAFLVHVHSSGTEEAHIKEDAEEFRGLVDALGWTLAGEIDANLRAPQPALLLGTGKAEEVAHGARFAGATVIILDCALSPTQQRNWDRLTGLPVMDRQGLILEIFADRAQTREAQLQVGLARMEYMLPRLANSYTELSRQRGGNKNKGQGETQIELDRRLIQDRIHKFKELIEDVRAQRNLSRKGREQAGTPSIALVGYTNAGKSSIQRAICNSDTYVADALFATLDPSARQCLLPSGKSSVLIDTVGFIRKLPHGLVEAFKATLEESTKADVLVHVVDVASPWAMAHYQATMEVLKEIGAGEQPVVLALNKIDKQETWKDLQVWFEKCHNGPVVPVSAVGKIGLEELLSAIDLVLNAGSKEGELQLSHRDGKILSWLYSQGAVLERWDTDEGPRLKVCVNAEQEMRLADAGFAISVPWE